MAFVLTDSGAIVGPGTPKVLLRSPRPSHTVHECGAAAPTPAETDAHQGRARARLSTPNVKHYRCSIPSGLPSLCFPRPSEVFLTGRRMRTRSAASCSAEKTDDAKVSGDEVNVAVDQLSSQMTSAIRKGARARAHLSPRPAGASQHCAELELDLRIPVTTLRRPPARTRWGASYEHRDLPPPSVDQSPLGGAVRAA